MTYKYGMNNAPQTTETTEAKHTAGPWVTVAGDGRSDAYVREERMTDDGRRIAIAQVSKTGRTYSEFRANAALIAGAPQMFAALKEAEEAMSSADYFRTLALNPHTREMCERALASIRNAIACSVPK